jgi:membrane-bound ClpP family serine protease
MSVTLVFFTTAIVGVVFLFISLFVGHDSEVNIDAEIEGGPSFLSFRSLSVFLTAFGAVGAIPSYYFPGTKGIALFSSVLGILSGVVMCGIYLVAMRMVYGQQASSLITDKDLIGAEGRVTIAIPENGLGEITCLIGPQATRRMARSGKAIDEGTIVRIRELHGDVVVVEPIT